MNRAAVDVAMLPAARLLLQAARHSSSASCIDSAACQLPRSFVTAVPAADRLFGACVLERLPVIMPEVPEWETEYLGWKAELQNKGNKELPEEFTKGKTTYESEDGEGAAQQWQPAPRETEADVAMDTKSLRRRLDQRLFLLVKTKGDSSWQFPQAESSAGETMRQTAERALKETIQEGPKTYFVGNAPMGHVDQSSSRSFFHKAQLIKGQAALKQGGQAVEYAWVAKDEMPQYINDQETQTLLSKMLGR